MLRLPVFLATLLLPLAAVAGLTNQLGEHPSPYLAMHGADPVHWQEWGPAALERARSENKPLFVSSGYFACHWCHVMQQESYRNVAIAALLNAHFIPVKVDRELQPALDAYLIDFVERTMGSAGWPLNVIITPQGHPLLGLTYAPPETFQRLLVRVSGAWQTQADALEGMAATAAAELVHQREAEELPLLRNPSAVLLRLKAQALRIGDGLQGGFGHQSRFPMAPQLTVLLELQAAFPDPELADFLRLTLDRMAGQGLRDQLAGGFFRYTVDPGWQVPHFEKMLYNQALHIPLYLRAAEVLERPTYREVARDTLDFVLQWMRTPDGGFIASLSALDDQGEEGGAYLWQLQQLEALLEPDERRLVARVWGMGGSPNNEGGYLPVQVMSLTDAAGELEMEQQQAAALLSRAKGKLLLARSKRGLPRDEKRIAAWNGLMLSALAAGVRAFGDAYRKPGQELRDFLVRRMWDGKQLHRALGAKGPLGEAALEDYAFVARGLADWAELDGGGGERRLAPQLVRTAWRDFFDGSGWRHSAHFPIPAVPAEAALPDSPLPSPAAVLIDLVLRLDETGLQSRVERSLRLAWPVVEELPFGYAGTAWVASRLRFTSEKRGKEVRHDMNDI